ncbi:GAF domain-containing protein [uncultured Acetobacteroides sp.]|uniref:GAF domain-containing protein n=1 Tax=uncultured Acetobacteroides sp. TaxID=1760811 RepID=UPI0029F58990|nr:GAF domain-containing protein [uncultured Acetobacteroides sp.]
MIGKENAARANDVINRKISAVKALASSYESHAEMGEAKFSLYKNMMQHLAKDENDIYAMWFIEEAQPGDTASVQKYLYSSKAIAGSDQLLQKVETELGYRQVRQTGGTWINDPVAVNDVRVINICVPISVNGKIIGAVGCLLNAEFLTKIVDESMKEEDGICKVVTPSGLVAANKMREKVGTILDEGDQTSEIMDCIKRGEQFSSFIYSAYFKEKSFKVYVPISFEGSKSSWSYCTIVPTSKMLHQSNMLSLFAYLLIALGVGLLVFIVNIITQFLTGPIVSTAKELKLIAAGRLNQVKEIAISSTDEIGQMVESLNLLTSSQKDLANFANEVGHGNLDASIEVKGNDDQIGNAMIEMKENLIAAKKAEEQRIFEDKIQDWKFEGTARIHDIIRKENQNIKHLCDTILQEIITYSKATQGGIFIINEDQTEERFIELVSCVAYNRKKMMAKRMEFGEGMVGRCIFEKESIILTEIPQDYLSITSGLGDRNPNFLAIIPLINNEVVVGAIEVASFDRMEQHVLEYLEKAVESLASAISNVKVNERTQRLLDQSKQYSEEMAAQEEELRQNMEEMQASQEEMHRKTQEYEETIAQLRTELGEKAMQQDVLKNMD